MNAYVRVPTPDKGYQTFTIPDVADVELAGEVAVIKGHDKAGRTVVRGAVRLSDHSSIFVGDDFPQITRA